MIVLRHFLCYQDPWLLFFSKRPISKFLKAFDLIFYFSYHDRPGTGFHVFAWVAHDAKTSSCSGLLRSDDPVTLPTKFSRRPILPDASHPKSLGNQGKNIKALDTMMRFIVTASAVITGGSAVYFYIFHQRLSSRIQHKSHSGKLSAPSPKPIEIESVPETIFTDQYYAIYDHSSKFVSRDSLPKNVPTEQLFSKLVRRNMTAFTRFPQALVIRLISRTPEEQRSFKSSHISSLDFNKGDLVCGVYRVVARTKNKVEFEITMKNMEFVNGRLAISFRETESEVVFSSETLMWRRSDETQAMPMEKPLLRWMHETASWWLLDSGVKYLMEIESWGIRLCKSFLWSLEACFSLSPILASSCVYGGLVSNRWEWLEHTQVIVRIPSLVISYNANVFSSSSLSSMSSQFLLIITKATFILGSLFSSSNQRP